jgi:hypothetical protein
MDQQPVQSNSQPTTEQPVVPSAQPVQPQPVEVNPQPQIYQPVVVLKKKKSLLWLWITLAIVAMVIFSVAVLAIIKFTAVPSGAKKLGETPIVNQNSDDSTFTITADFPLTKNIMTTGDVAWGFPGSLTGWDMTVFDQNGVNQLQKQSSQTMFTSYQLLKTGISSPNDADGTKQFLDDYITGFKTKATVSNQKDSTTKFLTSDGKSVEFMVRDYTYTTSQGTYTSKLVARVTDKYSLSLLYAGVSSEVSDTEWQTLAKSVMVVGTLN